MKLKESKALRLVNADYLEVLEALYMQFSARIRPHGRYGNASPPMPPADIFHKPTVSDPTALASHIADKEVRRTVLLSNGSFVTPKRAILSSA